MSDVIIVVPPVNVIDVVITPPPGEGAPVEIEVINSTPTPVSVEVLAPELGVTEDELQDGMAATLTSANSYSSAGDTTTLQAAKDYTDQQIEEIPDSPVSSVFGRTGLIVAGEGDYQEFYPKLSIQYMDPAWIGELSYNKISGKPTTLSGYGITDGVSTSGNRSLAGLTTLGSSSIAPTHSLTIPSSGTGWAHYNTVDQTERVLGSWVSNVYTISVGGTGTARALRLTAGVGSLTTGGATITGIFNFGASAGTANVSWIGTSGTMSAATGTQRVVSLLNTINQSGSAGFDGIYISLFQQGLGTGAKWLINGGTNAAANGGGAHAQKFGVTNTGLIVSSGTPSFADNDAALAGGLAIGSIYHTSGTLKIVI